MPRLLIARIAYKMYVFAYLYARRLDCYYARKLGVRVRARASVGVWVRVSDRACILALFCIEIAHAIYVSNNKLVIANN